MIIRSLVIDGGEQLPVWSFAIRNSSCDIFEVLCGVIEPLGVLFDERQ
jgi:hypothetical protein